MYFNARSIFNRQSELSEFLSYYKSDIVGISETWCNDDTPHTAFCNKYQVFTQNRPLGNGGGVLLAIKNDIPCKFVTKGAIGRCEFIMVDVKYCGSNYVRYALVYRPPDIDLETSLRLFRSIHEYLKNVQLFVIMGDFNLPDISWSEMTASSRISQEFLTLCFRLGAEQYVNFPTRGDNILDLVLCSNRGLVSSVSPEPPFANSDHTSILCHMAQNMLSRDVGPAAINALIKCLNPPKSCLFSFQLIVY